MSEQTKSKTPFTDKHEVYVETQYREGEVVPSEQVRKLEAVKIQMEEALRTVLDQSWNGPIDSEHFARKLGSAALKQSEELNND